MTRTEPSPDLRPSVTAKRVDVWIFQYGIVAATVALFVILSVWSDAFFTVNNLTNILEQSAPVAIVAVCTTPLLIARGIDLSMGATFGLAGIVSATVANAVNPAIGLLVGAVVGIAVGLGNGILSTRFGVNALIGTIATGIIISGISVVVSGGFAVVALDPSFMNLGNDEFLGLGYAAWIWILAALIGQWVLSATAAGRRIFATGGNPEAASLAGIRVDRVLVATFMLSGLGAAVGGMIAASSVGQATADMGGNGILFAALTAVIVGGTSIQGGEGAIWRTVVGVLFVAMINNGMNLLGVEPVYTSIVQGSLILLAVILDALGRRRRRR
jgi:ribose transport system permease protein